VQILPQASKLTPEPAVYRRNDPATGRVRWRGKLTPQTGLNWNVFTLWVTASRSCRSGWSECRAV
jgi:hypothetical protein